MPFLISPSIQLYMRNIYKVPFMVVMHEAPFKRTREPLLKNLFMLKPAFTMATCMEDDIEGNIDGWKYLENIIAS